MSHSDGGGSLSRLFSRLGFVNSVVKEEGFGSGDDGGSISITYEDIPLCFWEGV